MGYHEVLASMIRKSGLTLKEISDLCDQKYKVKIDQSYISKLQSGKQSPASESVNTAIAKVCGGEPEELLLEAYLAKAPTQIKKFFEQLIVLTRDMTKILHSQKTPDLKPIINKQVDNLSDYEIMKDLLSNQFVRSINANNKYILNKFKDTKMKKVLEKIVSGPIMIDNSMEPIIPKDASLLLGTPDKGIDNGDIVAVVFNDESYIIRKYVQFEDKIILIPENRNYETTSVKKEDILFASRVISMTIKL